MTDPISRTSPVTPAQPAARAAAPAAPAAPAAVPSSLPPRQLGTVVDAHQPGTFSYTTTMKYDAKPEDVLKAVQGDWNQWWVGGTQSNRQATPEGGATFDLSPLDVALHHGMINVHAKMEPARAEYLNDGTNGIKVVLPTTLSGNFEGHSSFTIVQAPDGGTYLISQWKDMKPHGVASLMGDKALQAHFLAENNALANLGLYLAGKTPKPLPMSALAKLL